MGIQNIHQIAPPFLPIYAAITYGGIERVMYSLDGALTRLGYHTSMSATEGSKPIGTLYPTTAFPITLLEGSGKLLDSRLRCDATLLERMRNGTVPQNEDAFPFSTTPYYLRLEHIATALEHANRGTFDVIHCHDENMFPFASVVNKPMVFTIHSPPNEYYDPRFHPRLFSKDLHICAVSNRIRTLFNERGWNVKYVVHNGFDIDKKYFSDEKIGYFLSLGIITPRKGHHLAIEVAQKLGKNLVISGNLDPENLQYFEEQIKPHVTDFIEGEQDKLFFVSRVPVDSGRIIYTGSVNDQQKFPLFQHADAFLVFSAFEDPFPGVVIEAMACGTPVVGWRKGGIPEMIEQGFNGYVVQSVQEAISHIKNLRISPSDCRQHYEEEFTSERMAENYLKVYETIQP